VMDGVLRHLAGILDDAGILDAAEFWDGTRLCLEAPDSDDLHGPTWDAVFAPRFAHYCLNRLQRQNTPPMVAHTDQAGSLPFAGTRDNPLAVRSDAVVTVP